MSVVSRSTHRSSKRRSAQAITDLTEAESCWPSTAQGDLALYMLGLNSACLYDVHALVERLVVGRSTLARVRPSTEYPIAHVGAIFGSPTSPCGLETDEWLLSAAFFNRMRTRVGLGWIRFTPYARKHYRTSTRAGLGWS